MNNIWVDADMVWIPNLYVSNRVQDFGPSQEVQLRCNIEFDGLVTFYRSLRRVSKLKLFSFEYNAHPLIVRERHRVSFILKTGLRLRATYTSDSTMYPYDTQITQLQIQSRDYSKVFIELNTISMNKLYGLGEKEKKMEPTDKLGVMQNDLYATRNVSI